jgi:hypothetical protein
MKIKTLLWFFICIVTVNISAKPPRLSGNFEQGSRYAISEEELDFPAIMFDEVDEDIDQETWAYEFTKGYLQLSQTLNDRMKYVFKYDYLYKDFFAADTNNRNRLDYYRTYSWIGLSDALKLKVEYYLRNQDYEFRSWDNLTHVPHMLLQFKPDDRRAASISLRYKAQRYNEATEEWKDKNEVISYLAYKEKVFDKLTVNAKYKYTIRHYTDNPDETDAIKKSFSMGFDYQF